jgi:hypothetical protein
MSEPISQKEYWDDIHGIAKDAVEEGWAQAGKDADEPDEEAIREYVQQTIDGHQWIIYYGYPAEVLSHTENKNAYFEDFGPLESKDADDALAKMAYAAMERDVWDYIQREDLMAERPKPKRKPRKKR